MSGLRIAYLSGPVDASIVHDCWAEDRAFSNFGTSYLTQFYQLCADLDAECLVVTTEGRQRASVRRHKVEIENYPPSASAGIAYHIATAWAVMRIGATIARFRPQAVILTAHQDYWFLLSFLRLLGTEVIVSAHCALWRPYRPTPSHLRALLRLNGWFLRTCVRHAMAISRVAADQVRELSRHKVTVHEISPTYARAQFEAFSPPVLNRPLRVLFAGRTERNKGVFDLLEIAGRLEHDRPGDFVFDLCGEGSDLVALRAGAHEAELGSAFRIHGFCERDRLAALLAESHVVIAPTRSDFEEGFNKTCVEAVLAHRPFVSSPVCPASYSLAPAALVVAPDDVQAYEHALVSLADDPSLYAEKSRSCAALQDSYFSPDRSYKATLRRILGEAGLIGVSA